jgi:hypothetical protein
MPISSALGSSALLPGGLGFRNAIINGDFRINQRGFSSTTGNGVYGFDRWRIDVNGGTTTYSAQTFTAGNAISGQEPTNYARVITSGQTNVNGVYSLFRQPIEDVRTFAGQIVTVSFWARSGSGTPKVAVELEQNFGSGGSAGVTQYAGQITLSTSWQRFVLTTTIPSISGKTIGANSHLLFTFILSGGPDWSSRSGSIGIQSNTFDFWGVQVEQNYQPTPFEQRPIGIELILCQRYFYIIPAGGITVYNPYWNVGLSGGGQWANYNHPTEMRAVPTLRNSSGGTSFQFGYPRIDAGATWNGNLAEQTITTKAIASLLYSSVNNGGSQLAGGAVNYSSAVSNVAIHVSAEL